MLSDPVSIFTSLHQLFFAYLYCHTRTLQIKHGQMNLTEQNKTTGEKKPKDPNQSQPAKMHQKKSPED